MNTLCVMCALKTTGSSCVPLSQVLPDEQAEPEQVRQHERHEHGREERRDAALAPCRFAQQEDQRRDQQEPRRLRSARRRRPWRCRSSRAIPRRTARRARAPARRPGCARTDAILSRYPPPAIQNSRIAASSTLSSATDTGIEHPSRTAAHLTASIGALPRRSGNGGRRGMAKAGDTFHETAVEHRGEGVEETKRLHAAASLPRLYRTPAASRPRQAADRDTGIMGGACAPGAPGECHSLLPEASVPVTIGRDATPLDRCTIFHSPCWSPRSLRTGSASA